MAGSQARITPLEPPYERELEELLNKWMPPGVDIEPLALFRVLALHSDLASRARPLGAGILAKGLVDPRSREVMIHRTCALTGAEYEWGVHVVAYGKPVGFTDAQLASTIDGKLDGAGWSDRERVVFRLADELHHTSSISDVLFEDLKQQFDAPQIVELCLTSGWYHALSYVINAARLEPESWAARFSESQLSAPLSSPGR